MHARAAKPDEFGWLVERAGCHLTSEARGIVAVNDRGQIQAFAAFDWWTENSAQAHLAVDSPMALRCLTRAALPWFFTKTGREVLMGVVRASNERALKLNRHLGFREVHRVKGGAAKAEDLVLLEMRRDDCKILRGMEHGHS